MTRKFQSLVLFTICLVPLITALISQAQTADASTVPRLMRYVGVARDAEGKPLTGVLGITFALYSEQTSSAALWTETQTCRLMLMAAIQCFLGRASPMACLQSCSYQGRRAGSASESKDSPNSPAFCWLVPVCFESRRCRDTGRIAAKRLCTSGSRWRSGEPIYLEKPWRGFGDR